MTGDYFTPPGVALEARQGSYCFRKVVKTLCSSENNVVRFAIVCLWREWMRTKMVAYCLALYSLSWRHLFSLGYEVFLLIAASFLKQKDTSVFVSHLT